MTQNYEKYSMAVDEIRLSRNLKNLRNLAEDFDQAHRPKYLVDEIDYLKRRLNSLRNQRTSHDQD